jgi:hypothetical protein
MTEDQLTEILNRELAKFAGQMFQHFDERLDKLETELATRADGERIYRALDSIAKHLDTDDAERAAMNAQLDRHERWHHQTADKLGLKLDYQEG